MTNDRTDDDRFGVADSSIRAALERHRGIIRAGTYVPTRSEVRAAPMSWATAVVRDWVWESPSELVPTNAMIEELIAVLESRPDAKTDEVRRLIAELRTA